MSVVCFRGWVESCEVVVHSVEACFPHGAVLLGPRCDLLELGSVDSQSLDVNHPSTSSPGGPQPVVGREGHLVPSSPSMTDVVESLAVDAPEP